MNRLRYMIVAMILSMAVLVSSSTAVAASPREYIVELIAASREVMKVQEAEDANSTFAEEFDMPTFAKRCMIDHWSDLSEEQHAEFIDAFAANLRGQLAKMMRKVGRRGDFSYEIGTLTKGKKDGFIRVPVRVIVEDVDLKFRYFVLKTDAGYRLVDYEVDGVLLSRNYRGQFNYMMRKYGFDGLIAKMRRKIVT